MRNKAFTTVISAWVLVAALVLSGCGGKNITAEEYVQGIYKLMVNMDSEGVKDLGVSDSDVKKYTEAIEKSVNDTMSSMNDSFKQQFGVSVDDELLKACGQEYINALKRLSGKTSLESSTDKEYKVKVSTTVLDMPAIVSKAMEAAQSKVKASEYETSAEYNKVLIPTYVSELKEGLAKFTPSSEEVTVTVTVKKDGNKWTADLAELSAAIAGAAVKKG
ncbi:MAG: DUF5105 domain-containing protein [Lachnospiraceae bacterium]|nr:DUF5105 domain-containing protein [Lachnospiraceae bacterium]